ncbi:MAG: hypothetical protein IH962_00965, partial [Chloroflexi bacterium]|nr:hypothetical protein [Chloroflexota bacterium]
MAPDRGKSNSSFEVTLGSPKLTLLAFIGYGALKAWGGFDLLYWGMLTLAFPTAVVSLIYVLRKAGRKIYLFFFQVAFFSSFAIFFLMWDKTEAYGLQTDSGMAVGFYWLCAYGLTALALLWLLIDRLFITYWKRKLVVQLPETPETDKPISIYPDAATYIDVHGKAEWLEKFIRTSDGGVVGLTGVRGAGKSALLNKIISELDDEFFTLHITSPVHSNDRMEFFMMVCREVCAKVIKEVEEKIFRMKNTVSTKAREGLTQRIRYILLLIVVISAGAVFYSTGAWRGIATFPVSEKGTSVGVVGASSRGEEWFEFKSPSDFLLQVDKICIKTLLARIDAYLSAEESTFNRLLILPLAKENFLHILPVVEDNVNLKETYDIFMDNYGWLNTYEIPHFEINSAESERLNKDGLFDEGERLNEGALKTIYFTQMIRSIAGEQFSQNVPSPYSVRFKVDLQAYMSSRAQERYLSSAVTSYTYRLCSYLYHNMKPNTAAVFTETAGIDESRANYFTDAVGGMFGVDGSFAEYDHRGWDTNKREWVVTKVGKHPKLMSWVLLEAFFTHARNDDKETLLLDRQNRVPQLRDLLAAYLAIFPREKSSGDLASMGRLDLGGNML